MTTPPLDHVDVYPVGALANVIHAYGAARAGRWALVKNYWKSERRTIRRYVVGHDWHNLRQHLNGYLAEPYHWPTDGSLTKCGRGWTRAAAMRSLRKRGWRY